MNKTEIAKYIKVSAKIRYWEDAFINGIEDTDGTLTPYRNGNTWEPVINLETGELLDWPEGMTAEYHYKVCDAGEYHLLDENKEVIASRLDNYVPDGLCHGDNGYGDYIIFNVGTDGKIIDYRKRLDESDWNDIDDD